MVYLKGILVLRITLSVVLLNLLIMNEATRIAYKKPLNGKRSIYQDRRIRVPKQDMAKSATNTAMSTATKPRGNVKNIITDAEATSKARVKQVKATEKSEQLESSVGSNKATSTSVLTKQTGEEVQLQINMPELNPTTMMQQPTEIPSEGIVEAKSKEIHINVDAAVQNGDDEVIDLKKYSIELHEDDSIAATVVDVPPVAEAKKILVKTSTTSTTENNLPVPCTCGIFMTSQIKRNGLITAPQGRPVIVNELDRTYACNAIGQKQCQTKCLETLVQHLPNSANILCATLDRDCRKERAYLFIKNCRNLWLNTNLTAGREYCCKDGQPYQCPLI